MNSEILIIGAGPAGIFTALELVRKGYTKKIVIVEQGRSIYKRNCPKSRTTKCVDCKPHCNITSGFSGAGAFSDGKLSLSFEVGGDLPQLSGSLFVQSIIDYTDKIYLEFGADTKIEGINTGDAVKEIRRKAIKAGLKLIDCPIRHLGTEKAQDIYGQIEKTLIDKGVEILFDTDCVDIITDSNKAVGAKVKNCRTGEEAEIFAQKVIVATGRKGANWFESVCRSHNVKRRAGTVDIGVRVEVRNEIMEEVNNVLYESKLIGYPEPFKDKVRTFCQNPGGFVSQENYDNKLAVVNGHSYKELKSENTNLAVLSSHNFTHPFDRPIDYAQKVGEITNMLGGGNLLVQRFGDIESGKRTWQKELERSNVRPTLKDAVAGDITAAMPYRTMLNIVNFIKSVDYVVPGFASNETLLYSPEIKFYSNRVDIDQNYKTNIDNLYALGDSSGWTRGLMMASVMGVIMAHKILG